MPTGTKKTKAEKIRDYLREHPDSSCPQVASALRLQVHSSEFTQARKKLGLPLGSRSAAKAPKAVKAKKKSRVIVPGKSTDSLAPAMKRKAAFAGVRDVVPLDLEVPDTGPPAEYSMSNFALLEALDDLADKAPEGVASLRKLLDVLDTLHEVGPE